VIGPLHGQGLVELSLRFHRPKRSRLG
jgi:hypothetical protein